MVNMCKDQAAHISKVELLARSLTRFGPAPLPDPDNHKPAGVFAAPLRLPLNTSLKDNMGKVDDTSKQIETLQACEEPSTLNKPQLQWTQAAHTVAASSQPADGFDAKFIRARSDGSLAAQGVKTEIKVLRAFRR